jgi:hypothetical protein
MEKLTRRSALKKLIGASLTAAAAPLFVGCSKFEPQITLNVVLHGLFVLNFTNLEIELFTPFMDDHIYRAGNWDWNCLEHLQPKKSYRLRGVEYRSTPPDLNLNCNILFPREGFQHQVHPERTVFTVYLPFPETIRLIRIVDAGLNVPEPNNTLRIHQLSLCQVLSYRVPDYRNLDLLGTRWKPKVDHATNTANLHFWAEPPLRVPYSHACDAYAKLSELLEPLTLKLGTNKTAPLDPDTGVYGLPREQEQGLSEWESGGEGSYPTNCSLVMVKNIP